MFARLIYLKNSTFPGLKITVDTVIDVRNKTSNHHFLKSVKINTSPCFLMHIFQSVSGHSSEQSITCYSSQPPVLQLYGVSDTISKWFKNLQPQRTQISTIANPSSIQNSNWMTSCVDWNCKFSVRTFSTPAISKATPKLFSSQVCSDDKNCLYFSSIFFKICRFCNSILLSL